MPSILKCGRKHHHHFVNSPYHQKTFTGLRRFTIIIAGIRLSNSDAVYESKIALSIIRGCFPALGLLKYL